MTIKKAEIKHFNEPQIYGRRESSKKGTKTNHRVQEPSSVFLVELL